MSQAPLCLVSFTVVSLLVGNILGAAPALGASLTRQEFEGDFSLVNTSPLLEDNLPGASEYSGFVVYEQDGTLRDWQVNVNQLNLNLNPEATEEPIPATVSFELSSASNWNLVVDFGIAFDAPRYTLERSLSEISLTGEVGLAGGYVYTDSAADITPSTSSIPVPEPSTQLGLLFAASALAIFRKASQTKA